MRVWRITRDRYRASAFSGEGTLSYSGRWNPAGLRMVYTASSLALAALECFVHTDPSIAPLGLIVVTATLPDELALDQIDFSALPADWRTLEHPEPKRLGAEWARSSRSLALRVPSAVVDGEWNILINPLHPEFNRIAIEPARPWAFDERLFARG